MTNESRSARQLPEELLLIHAVLEGFAAINEDDWNLVVELAAKLAIRVNVNFLPGKPSASRKL
jgi:hypothetical protein